MRDSGEGVCAFCVHTVSMSKSSVYFVYIQFFVFHILPVLFYNLIIPNPIVYYFTIMSSSTKGESSPLP